MNAFTCGCQLGIMLAREFPSCTRRQRVLIGTAVFENVPFNQSDEEVRDDFFMGIGHGFAETLVRKGLEIPHD